jgi:tetratricopeptide (TPR) repeat protein
MKYEDRKFFVKILAQAALILVFAAIMLVMLYKLFKSHKEINDSVTREQKVEVEKVAKQVAEQTARKVAQDTMVPQKAAPRDPARAWDLFREVKVFAFKDDARLAEARDKLIQASELDPHNVEVINLLGRICAHQKNYSDSQEYFKSALKISRNHVGALQGLITVLLIERKFDESRTYVDRLRAINPKDPKITKFESWIAKEEREVSRKRKTNE